jgi:hypothetical protein
MSRVVLAIVAVVAVPAVGRAEILPSFGDGRCETAASHVVVVDDTGKVLDSWRGDLRPGDRLPLSEYNIRLAQPVGQFGKKEGAPEKVSGKRLVLFLQRGGPTYDQGQGVGSLAAAHWVGEYNVSTLWIEDGHAFALSQWINPGPQEMTHIGTEAGYRKRVEQVNGTVRDLLAKARAEQKLDARANILGDLVINYPGFSAEALAGLEWCGVEALPALRKIVSKDRSGDPELLGTYAVMAKIGAPARADLMKHLVTQLEAWKYMGPRVEYVGKLEADSRRMHEYLLAVTSNPAAFPNLTAEHQKTVRDLRDLWAANPVLSKLGEKGDRITDRLDRLLKQDK